MKGGKKNEKTGGNLRAYEIFLLEIDTVLCTCRCEIRSTWKF